MIREIVEKILSEESKKIVVMYNFGLDKIRAIKYIKQNYNNIEVEEIGNDGLKIIGDEKTIAKVVKDLANKYHISNDNIEYVTEENWTQNVKPKWHPPKGTFAKDTPASKSAEVVCKGHKGDLKSAVASVNFFFNRCGEKCADWGEKKRKEIIDILHKICK